MVKVHACGNRIVWSVLTFIGVVFIALGAGLMAKAVNDAKSHIKGCNNDLGNLLNNNNNNLPSNNQQGSLTCFFDYKDETSCQADGNCIWVFGLCSQKTLRPRRLRQLADCTANSTLDEGEKAVGTWFGGIACVIIGIIFVLSFSWGICPVCCYAKEETQPVVGATTVALGVPVKPVALAPAYPPTQAQA
jgi:hypothetical protein